MYKVFHGPHRRVQIGIFDRTKLPVSVRKNEIIYTVTSLPNHANKNTAFCYGHPHYHGDNKDDAILETKLICDNKELMKIKKFINDNLKTELTT